MKATPGNSFVVPLANLGETAKQLNMIWVAPNTFEMGIPNDDPSYIDEDDEIFTVELTDGFWLSQYVVTQGQWKSVMETEPSYTVAGEDYPVHNVNWYETFDFCAKLNEVVSIQVPDNYHFKLPTEAQWEYTCKYEGKCKPDNLSEVAWYSLQEMQRVGLKLPNKLGFYDMLGNVAEWCLDTPPQKYPRGEVVTNWIGHGDQNLRCTRGGTYLNDLSSPDLNCSFRLYANPKTKRSWYGFRLCLSNIELTKV